MCRFPEENQGGLGQSSPSIPLKANVLQAPPLAACLGLGSIKAWQWKKGSLGQDA